MVTYCRTMHMRRLLHQLATIPRYVADSTEYRICSLKVNGIPNEHTVSYDTGNHGDAISNQTIVLPPVQQKCCQREKIIRFSLSRKKTKTCNPCMDVHKCQRRHFTSWCSAPGRHMCRLMSTFNIVKGTTARSHSSSLFVSDAFAQNTAPVEIDLDLERKTARKAELIRNMEMRGINFDVELFATADALKRIPVPNAVGRGLKMEDYRLMKRLEKEKLSLEHERENIAKKMAGLKKLSMNSEEDQATRERLVGRGKQVKEALKELQMSWWVWEERVMLAALDLPNNIRHQMPEKQPIVLQEAGNIPDTSRSHLDVAREGNLIKFSAAGPRSYYLRGDLADLEQRILQSVSGYLTQRQFCQLACPEVFRTVVAEGCAVDYRKNLIFTLENTDDETSNSGPRLDDFAHIQGTSLLSFAAYLAKTVVTSSCLPHRLFTMGRQYTPVPEMDDKVDLPGLFGATQSMKVSALSVCADRAVESSEFCKMATSLWRLYQPLGVPMRLVSVPASGLLNCESLRLEVQMWAPSLQKYLQVGHVSCLDDFVSRRLMCYHGNNPTDYKSHGYLQMVYGELLDTTRLLGLLLEHYGVNELGGVQLPGSSDCSAPQTSDIMSSLNDMFSTTENLHP